MKSEQHMLDKDWKRSFLGCWLIIAVCLSVILMAGFAYTKARLHEETTARMVDRVAGKLRVASDNIDRTYAEYGAIIQIATEAFPLSHYLKTEDGDVRDAVLYTWSLVLENFTSFKQLRLLDPEGWEIVRLERDKKTGEIKQPERYQYKGGRDYFIAAQGLGAGELLVFGFDIEREFGVPVMPPERAHRIISPVDKDGVRLGYLILNLGMELVLKRATQEIQRRFQVESVDEDGYYIWSKDSDRTFGQYLPGRSHYNLRRQLPELASLMAIQDSGTIDIGGTNYVFDKLLVDLGVLGVANEYLVATITPESIDQVISSDYRALYWGYAVAAGVLFALSFPLAVALQRRYLAKSYRLLVMMSSQAMTAMLITDTRGRILFANDAVSKTLGYRKDEILGQTPGLFKSGVHDQAYYDALWSALDKEGEWSGEVINRHKDGSLITEYLKINALRRDPKRPVSHYVASFIDISQFKEMEQQLRKMTITDSLTGIFNRRYYDQQIEHHLAMCKRRPQDGLVVALLDIDHFKKINDTHGHDVGDEVLKRLSRQIANEVRETDFVARIGGEEFVLVLPRESLEGGKIVMERIRQTVANDISEPRVQCSIGYTIYTEDDTEDSIYRRADEALYKAKTGGRNRVVFGDPETKAEESL